MIVKKNPNLQLENYAKPLLFLSLTFSLLLVYIVIEYKTYALDIKVFDSGSIHINDIAEESMVHLVKPVKKQVPIPEPVVEPVRKKTNLEKIEVIPDKSIVDPTIVIEDVKKSESVTDATIDEMIDGLDTLDDPVDFKPETFYSGAISSAAVFPGCEKKKDQKKCFNKQMNRFIAKHFDKGIAEEQGLNGLVRIYTTFMIDYTGKVSEVKVRTSNGALKKEAIETINSLPSMIPASQNGKPVNLIFSLPILFEAQ